MKPDFTTWPTAPDYRFARAVIARLQEDDQLAPLVFAQPFDHEDQCQKLGANAQASGAVIMVTPQQMDDTHPEARSRVLRVRLSVSILATAQLSGGGSMTAAEVVATVRARVLRLLCGWMPEGRGLLPEEPQLEGTAEIDTAQYKGWANLRGSLIALNQRMLF